MVSLKKLLSMIFIACMLLTSGSASVFSEDVTPLRPGETDPALNYTHWRDDEIFLTTPDIEVSADTWKYTSEIYESNAALDTATLKGQIQYSDTAPPRTVVDAVSGYFLTRDKESVVEAYRSVDQLAIKFFDKTLPVALLQSLAPRLPGCTDFFDLSSGDLDGLPRYDPEDLEPREEVVVAYAQPGAKLTPELLPIQVSILDFGRSSDEKPVMTSILTSEPLAAPSLKYAIKPLDNTLAVATGDFDGNGLKEIAVVYLNSPQRLKVDVFRYSGTRSGYTTTYSLDLIGSGSVMITRYFIANLSAAVGDFNGDGRDELAVGTSSSVQSSGTEYLDETIRIFQFSGTSSLTITQAKEILLRDGPAYLNDGRVQVTSGLLKSGTSAFGQKRRQLAVAYDNSSSYTGGYVASLRTINFDDALTPTLYDPFDFPGPYSQPFWLTSGRFNGTYKEALAQNPDQVPLYSLAFSIWSQNEFHISLLQTETDMELTQTYSKKMTTKTSVPAGARMSLIAADTDGDTIYLGAPVHFTVENLVNTDFIIQEPPKHAYWDQTYVDPVTGAKGIIVNVSRYDGFNTSLINTENETFSSTNKDIMSYAVGGSASASAGAKASAGGDIGIFSASAEAAVEVKASVGYDYENTKSNYTTSWGERTVQLTRTTDRDDFIIGRLQVLDIWRYRVYGIAAPEGVNPFFDVIIPGGEDVDIPFSAGGLFKSTLYQPTHENGNLLSYPRYVSGLTPSDLGVEDFAWMKPYEQLGYDGTSGTDELKITAGNGTGTERIYAHKLNANASINTSAKVSGGAFGSSLEASTAFGLEVHGNASWSNTATSENKTSNTTSITLNKPVAEGGHAYAFYPAFYVANDGTIKVTYAVDPMTDGNLDRDWWLETYEAPDLALNLPWRFNPLIDSGKWTPRTDDARKAIRGFFVTKPEKNILTDAYDRIDPLAIRYGDTVRLETRVYNYSLQSGIPGGMSAKFYYIPMAGTKEDGERTWIGTASLPAFNPQDMVTASVEWDTNLIAGITDIQSFRIYVELDPENQLTNETYETESESTKTFWAADKGVWIDPGQNNEGYFTVNVASLPIQAPGVKKPAHVSLYKDVMTAINPRGKLVSGNVQAYLNKPLEVCVNVVSDVKNLSTSYVLLYNGDPEKGGELIGMESAFTGSIEGYQTWFTWIPTEKGPYRLYAKVLQSVDDTAPGNNTAMLKVEVIPVPPGLQK